MIKNIEIQVDGLTIELTLDTANGMVVVDYPANREDDAEFLAKTKLAVEEAIKHAIKENHPDAEFEFTHRTSVAPGITVH